MYWKNSSIHQYLFVLLTLFTVPWCSMITKSYGVRAPISPSAVLLNSSTRISQMLASYKGNLTSSQQTTITFNSDLNPNDTDAGLIQAREPVWTLSTLSSEEQSRSVTASLLVPLTQNEARISLAALLINGSTPIFSPAPGVTKPTDSSFLAMNPNDVSPLTLSYQKVKTLPFPPSRLYDTSHFRLPTLTLNKDQKAPSPPSSLGRFTPHNGCGDWLSFKNYYYKLCFPEPIANDMTSPSVPFVADETCRAQYGAKLASLHEPGAFRFAQQMIRKARGSGRIAVSIGLRKFRPTSRKLNHLYRLLWQWGGRGGPLDYTTHIHTDKRGHGTTADCAMLVRERYFQIIPVPCHEHHSKDVGRITTGYVCAKPKQNRSPHKEMLSGVTFPKASARPGKLATKQCPDGSVVHTFLPCLQGEDDDKNNLESPSANKLPLFQCDLGKPIHYSLLCDGYYDCVDGSDETRCQQPKFSPLLQSSFICANFQIIPKGKRCNGQLDCFDASDEESCDACSGETLWCYYVGCVPSNYQLLYPCIKTGYYHVDLKGIAVLIVDLEVKLDGFGLLKKTQESVTHSEGFYQCRDSYRIPSFLLNNGEKDCPLGEDEGIPAHNLTCPDYYRCRELGSCVHSDYVCDGIHHCPNKDDEMFCHWKCPRHHGCTCEGQAYTCSKMIDPHKNLHVRYLDLSRASGVSLENIHVMEYIFFLNLSSCRLVNATLKEMLHLLILDLSVNSLTGLASLNLYKLRSLVRLDISQNPFLQTLDHGFNAVLKTGTLHNMEVLIMENVGVEVIDSKAFSSLSSLSYLDVRANPIRGLNKDCLFGLTALEELHTDDSRLCCSYFQPSLFRCLAPVDELSSCSDMLAQDFFRASLWVLSALTVVGNTGVLIFRMFGKQQKVSPVSLILVKNLCVADLLMGIYMLMVGVADAVLRGAYVAKENEWKGSTICTVAGFLSFVSSEVSALVICLITVDRVLAICFPFSSRIHFSPRVTICACCVVWAIGIVLAAVPLLAGMEFYGENAICIPLPITRHQFSGQAYAFCVFIIANFALFVCIGLGQLLIYLAVRKASAAAGTERREQDLRVARRLFIIAFTDFCCWFPIGVMGLLASTGTPIPETINVWVAVFVLPLNSALNPFLYTLNGLVEQRKKRRMENKVKRALGNLQTEITKWQPSRVQDLMRICINCKVVKAETLYNMLDTTTEAAPVTLSRNNGNGEISNYDDCD